MKTNQTFPVDEFTKSILLKFFEQGGVENSLLALLNALKEFFPAAYLYITAVNFYQSSVKILYEISLDGVFSCTRGSNNAYGFFTAKNFFVSNEIKDYRVSLIGDVNSLDSSTYNEFRKNDSVHNSVLNIELFQNNDYHYNLGMRSQEKNAFTLDHAKLLTQIHAPLSVLIQNIIQGMPSFNPSKFTTAQDNDNSLELLERCQGLSGVRHNVLESAVTRVNVLIQGETGVGKEIVAQAIHENSRYKNGPFVKVNCGAIPESLLEAELFGYEKGAFTGAVSTHKGFFEQADGGTLYLDEVGELSLMAQVRLLRVLESREIQRIGGTRRMLLDFRLLTASNRNLAEMVTGGSFRADLWYRINTYSIEVPPLRRRREDVITLARFFIEKCSSDLELDIATAMSSHVTNILLLQEWRGNVRELRNWIERACIATKSAKSSSLCAPEASLPVVEPPYEVEQAIFKQQPTLASLEKAYIEQCIAKCNGKIQGNNSAAEILGINGSTLRAKMNKLGIPFSGKRKDNGW